METKEAQELAYKFLKENYTPPSGDAFQIIEKSIKEVSEGWFFPFQSKKYLETRNHDFLLLNTCPVFISKDGKTVEHRRP